MRVRMSNRTYICIDCRTARRAEAAGWVATSLRCAACGGGLWELSHKWRIPKKGDDKEWDALHEIIRAEAPTREQYLKRRGIELIEQIDKRMVALENRKIFAGRTARLKRLRNEKQSISELYFRRNPSEAAEASAKAET
jgi:hypothetical protein